MITLKAEKRKPNVKAKKLRREGYVTGILSGKEMKEPVALQFDAAEAAKFIKANKEGTQIYLDIEGEKVDALVKNIDYNPIEKQLMALDFQALVAGEKVSTTVAVKLEHTELVQGIVEQEMEEIHYKADPANLLDTIVIDFNGYPADVRPALRQKRNNFQYIRFQGIAFKQSPDFCLLFVFYVIFMIIYIHI